MSNDKVNPDAVFGGIYGPSKYGKTTDCLYAFPRGVYVAHPAALKPSENVVGYKLHPSQIQHLSRVDEVTKLLPKVGRDFDAVVIDDFSLLTQSHLAYLESKGHNGFKLWGRLRDDVLELRDAARTCGRHVIINCHEDPPKTKNGFYIRGGPQLPGKLTEDLPTQMDLILRAFSEPSRKGAWPVVYRCGPNDPSYITGDRHGVTPDMAPMNLGEIFRMANYRIRRAPGLEWMDEVVELAAQTLIQTPPEHEKAVLNQVVQLVHGKHSQNPLHIRWVLRDSLDRVVLRRVKQNLLNAFFV